MKKMNFVLLFFLLPVLSFSQTVDLASRKFFDQVIDYSNNSEFVAFQYTEVKGSPYFSDKWLKGKIVLNDNTSFGDLEIKFDQYKNNFLLNLHDTVFHVSSSAKQIIIYPGGDTLNGLVFKNGYTIDDRVNAETYVQVLIEGKISLLKFLKKEIDDHSEYSDATRYKRFIAVNRYFIVGNGGSREVTLTKKNLQDIFPDKKDEVADYILKYKADVKTENGWKLVIGYYNSL